MIIEPVFSELRYALRTLRRSPGFSLVAILTLALGIGANTALFSLVYGVLLRPLDYRDPDRLVAITAERDFAGRPRPVVGNFSAPDLAVWQARAHSFESIAMSAGANAALAGDAGVEVINVATVTPSFFSTVGGRFVLGRALGPADDTSPLVVISRRLWQRRLGGLSTIIGRQLVVDNQLCTIVGVADPTFQLPDGRTDLWRPVGFARAVNPAMAGDRAGGFLPIARLTSGATMAQARAESEAVAQAVDPHLHATAIPLRDRFLTGPVKPTLGVLTAAVGLVLFVACANVTNLIVARNTSRSRETAIRLALGVSRTRLLLQSVTHSGVIAAAGAMAGTLMAKALVAGFLSLNPAGIPRLDAVRVDTPVLLFAAALAAATTLGVGLLPAFQSADVWAALRIGGPGVIGGLRTRRVRTTLVVAELAVSVLLLVGASLLGRSFELLMHTDIGVTTDHVTAALVDLTFGRALSMSEQQRLIDAVVARLRAIPGVTNAGAGASLPPNLARLRFTLDDAGGRLANYMIDVVSATPGYFSTLGVRLQTGRVFTDADGVNRLQVMVMSAATARQIFGDADPIGRALELPMLTSSGKSSGRITLVGIVDSIKYSGLETAADAVIFRPFAQQPWPSMFVIVRTANEIPGLSSTIRRAIAAVDPSIAIQFVDTLDQLVSDAAAQPRFRTFVLVCIAVLAILLTGIGLYGVVAYSVAQRTAEIGIRMALGAATGDIVQLVLRDGMWMAAGGIAIGMLAARALANLIVGLLYGVQPTDVPSFGMAAAMVLLISIVASYVPARRASRIDPLVALRTE